MAAVQQIVIYGTRGFAREIHQLIVDLARAGEPIACAGFLVDDEFREEPVVHDLPVFGDASWLANAPGVNVVIGIGATAPRHRIAGLIERERFPVLRHARAWVGDRVTVGNGSVVCANAAVTTDISLGQHVQVHVGSTIGHDTVLEDFVTVAPGANISGRAQIGEGTFVGAGAVVLPDITIGRWCTIGAGAVVTRDLPDCVTAVGVPARIVAQR